ncbi:hypothetical protein AXG93_1647s1010 [Marchantia polymorpha subsp. ruderalis]|uniref:Uncharacterized protein n=1 Tax=Marchantia polymorpha subsp. ruderalis TaxID=1480154 RepID=A0A176VEN4_MARPO|nr:hypothetical protein AXG93_1647s1010 [Marchantia polymorpha subsp. ruderalis]
MMIKQQLMSSTQVPLGTIDLNCGKGPSTKEPKSAGLSAADVLDERIIPFFRYLDGKMAKYAEPAIARSYVAGLGQRWQHLRRSLELEQRERLDADCKEMRSQLSAIEEQLILAEARLMETKAKNLQLEKQTNVTLCAKVNRCLCGYVEL